MPEFFLELFSEEIPARMQAHAAFNLEVFCAQALKPLNFALPTAKVYFGARRIALRVEISAAVEANVVSERGPRLTAPEQALSGFLRKHGAIKEDLLQEGDFWVLHKKTDAQPAAAFLHSVLPETLAKLPWPKSMRWGSSGEFTWVRPLRRIVCLLDGEVIPFTLGPVTASNQTEGHRVHGRGPFTVSSAAEWEKTLRDNYVIAVQDERRGKIASGINKKVSDLGLYWEPDSELLDEVMGLVEYPVPLIGRIDDAFMDLPTEVRELSMKINQKYFALRDAPHRADWKPAPYFAFVANLEASDGGATIIAGNERVLRARLSDARFFWDLDLKTPLDALLPKLDKITFHAKIGTQGARVKRISALAEKIAAGLGADGEASEQAAIAGLLCKADLVTGMVGEFPELQGVMGGYYAERNPSHWNGAIVGPAIKTHYQPKGPSDAVPSGITAVSVALADKIDTLAEFFKAGEKPTGSGDPYALRRAALGVIRIILENRLSLHLLDLLGNQECFDFIIERLRVKLRGEGRRFDILDATLSAAADDDLTRLMQRVTAVTEFLATPDGANLLAAYRRAANILRIEDAKDGPYLGSGAIEGLGSPEAEALRQALTAIDVTCADRSGNYTKAMEQLATLRAPVDAFFDHVTVNDPNPELRRNRLQLLAKLRDTMHLIADFSKIEG